MKKILSIGCVSCLIFISKFSIADSISPAYAISNSITDNLLLVEPDGGSTPLPKKPYKLMLSSKSTASPQSSAPTKQAATKLKPLLAPQPKIQPTVLQQLVKPFPAQRTTGSSTIARSVAAQPIAQPVTQTTTTSIQLAVAQTTSAANLPVIRAKPQSLEPVDCVYHLQNAVASEKELSLWGQYAALKSFEYRFDKLEEQLTNLKRCFTEQGWTGFNEALQQSGNLSLIKNQHLVVSSQISGPTDIHAINNHQWQIVIPIEVAYQNNQEKFTQSLAITMIVTQKTTNELGIIQLIASVKPETA